MQKNQKKDKNADKQKKEYEPFRWQIVAILINFAPRPKTIEHSTSLFCFSKFLTTVNLYNGRANAKSLFLGKDFFWDTFRTSDAFTHWKKTLRQMDSSPLQTQRRGVTRENLRNQAS